MRRFLLTVITVTALIVLGVMLLRAEDKLSTPQPLNDAEKASITRGELNLLRAQQALSKAQQDLTNAVQKVYSDRKITVEQYTLCEAQAEPFCTKAPVNDLTLQPVPAKPELKKESR